jgi:hypothetical protein
MNRRTPSTDPTQTRATAGARFTRTVGVSGSAGLIATLQTQTVIHDPNLKLLLSCAAPGIVELILILSNFSKTFFLGSMVQWEESWLRFNSRKTKEKKLKDAEKLLRTALNNSSLSDASKMELKQKFDKGRAAFYGQQLDEFFVSVDISYTSGSVNPARGSAVS